MTRGQERATHIRRNSDMKAEHVVVPFTSRSASQSHFCDSARFHEMFVSSGIDVRVSDVSCRLLRSEIQGCSARFRFNKLPAKIRVRLTDNICCCHAPTVVRRCVHNVHFRGGKQHEKRSSCFTGVTPSDERSRASRADGHWSTPYLSVEAPESAGTRHQKECVGAFAISRLRLAPTQHRQPSP